MEEAEASQKLNLDKVIQDILGTIEREREREIVSRRFGLYDRRETLEQIGELLGITRERVRQLEKSVVTRLRTGAEKDLPHIKEVEAVLSAHLKSMGNVARISDVSEKIKPKSTKVDQARVAFLSHLSPGVAVIDDNDHFYHSIGLAELHNERAIRDHVGKIIDTVNKIGEPTSIENLAKQYGSKDTKHVEALAGISKNLANLHGRWGLTKWPMVNPKNIRDKIYVILHDSGKPMHFSEISQAIKQSDFRRKDVTTQAIHNELIKDKRFVLIGRGIYALREWGYKKGTVADVIAEVLRKEGGPLHRDEIVRRVLKNRQVKETTILLNLQGKPQFKRVAKATYNLAEA
ncbi:MAG TPA: sigma factor-like helix-turn-helix DNA-binding protein [Candidatus Saccharimonadales bacterium]|nr:sigma factor-like helix-turn-helix DNA-binding protein [Candidatus Saccharimonadales bacterium]